MSDGDRREIEATVAEELRRHLAWLADAGIREVQAAPAHVPDAPPAPPAASRDQGAAAPPARVEPPAPTVAPTTAGPPVEGPYGLSDPGCGSPALLAIRRELGDCARCKLGAGRTKLVFGAGSPGAELMFVGEGPGEDEDLQGEPFVGRAGQLLTKMIEAMGYRRGRRVHRERGEVPAAGQPEPGAGRDRRVRAVPPRADRRRVARR